MFRHCVTVFILLAIGFVGCRENRSHGPSLGESFHNGQAADRQSDFTAEGSLTSGSERHPQATGQQSQYPAANSFEFPSSPKGEGISEIIEEAKPFFDSLVQRFPRDVDAFDIRGRFYYFLGNHQVARNCWESGLKLNPQDPYCLNGLGLIHQAENDFESALAKFQQALVAKPKDYTLQLHVAKALVRLGRLDEAITSAERCLELSPDSVEAWELLGQTYQTNGQILEARQAFEQALHRTPQSFIAQQGMASVLVRLNQREEAKRWYELQKANRARSETAQTDDEKSERRELSQHLAEAANVLLKNGKTREAVATLNFAAACSPDELFPVQLLVEALQRLGRLNDAIKVADKFSKRHPDRIESHMLLFDLFFGARDWVKAVQTAEEAVRSHPENPQAHASLVKSLILAGGSPQRLTEASKHLVRLRGNAFDHVLYAQTLHLSGRLGEAIEALKLAVQLEPDNRDYQAVLSQLQSEELRK
jgi:tetratricopeptide (TPR) repeat protein